jgi:hypothetical protein
LGCKIKVFFDGKKRKMGVYFLPKTVEIKSPVAIRTVSKSILSKAFH